VSPLALVVVALVSLPTWSEQAEAEARPWLDYSADLALGFVTLDSFTGSTDGSEPQPTFERTRAWTTSLVLGAEHEASVVTFGARIPLLLGGLTSLESDRRQVGVALGNLELEVTHRAELAPALSLDETLELALPTATGEEAPLPGEPLGVVDPHAIMRGELLRAAEFSRGSLDSTLFEPGRVGFIPKLSLDWRVGHLHLRAGVKVELLFDVRGRAREHVIGEFVGSLRASYELPHLIEPFVGGWTNITFTEHLERDVDVVMLEPGLKVLLFGRLRPSVSVVLPVFGRLVTEQAIAVRVGLTGEL
jgi:hypothetical protein